MSMKDFHCDSLEVSFEFPREELNEDDFIKAAKIENKEKFIDEDGDFVTGITFGMRDAATDYHAHMRVVLFTKGESRIDIYYHDAKHETETIDTEPPYTEDCVQWLSSFFKTYKFQANIQATYLFDKSFSPALGLPFPLITTDKALAGTLVTGLSIVRPKENKMEGAIIQNLGDQTYLALTTTSEISLTDFDLSSQLEKLSASVNPLIKRQDSGNEKDAKRKDQK